MPRGITAISREMCERKVSGRTTELERLVERCRSLWLASRRTFLSLSVSWSRGGTILRTAGDSARRWFARTCVALYVAFCRKCFSQTNYAELA